MSYKINLPLFVFLIAGLRTISDRSIVGVEGLSLSSQTKKSALPLSPFLSRSRRFPSPKTFSHPPSYLRLESGKQEDSNNVVEANRIQKLCRNIKRGTTQCSTQLIRFWLKSRRCVLTMCTVILFWFGAAGTHTPVSHGSSSSTTTGTISRSNIFSSSLDQMVDKYVKGHMFDDDVYDPIESIYREAMDDRLKGSYPKDLKETTSSVLGQNVIKADKKTSGAGFSGSLMKTVSFLRKQGLSEIQAIALLTGFFVIGVPSLFFFSLMQIANQNRRSMNRLMKSRYGETYTVDASEKMEEDVDIPDDDDDDDDDE